MKKLERRVLALMLACCMVLTLLPISVFAFERTESDSPFSDIAETAWYADAVGYVYENELMEGVSKNCFAPNEFVTRAMLVTVLYRMDGCPEVQSADSFLDVAKETWYSNAVAWAKQKQIVLGVDKQHFAPLDLVTREQLVTILFRYAQYSHRDDSCTKDLAQYSDANLLSGWAESAMQWASGAEILTGKTETTIDPKGHATRAEVACMLMRFAENLADVSDLDGDGVPAYLEAYFGCSDEMEDSDGDGISDYIEIYQIGSDPAVADSDLDSDEDGLTNLEEVTIYGTNPVKADSDLDGLTDYEELFLYGTDPNCADTDGDGILDGDEIALGTDPKAATDLTQVTQELSADRIAEELMQDNAAELSVEGTSASVLDRIVLVSEATDEAIIKQSAVIGKAISLDMEEAADLTVHFALQTTVEAPAILELTADGWVLLDTQRDSSGVSATIDHSGKFCVADLQTLLTNMGLSPKTFYAKVVGASAEEENPLVSQDSILMDDFRQLGEEELVGAELEEVETDVTEFVRAYLAAKSVKREALDKIGSVKIMTHTVRAASSTIDSDYDGISDANDASPKSNQFSGTLLDNSMSSNVSYTFDYRTFFGNSKTYNKNLSITSLLFSTFIYSGGGFDFGKEMTYDGGKLTSTKSIKTLLAFHGMQDTVDYKLTAKAFGDDDLSEAAIGHHTVSYNGQTKQVVALIIRGTNGTLEEWSSNFDIGDTSKYNSYPDWRSKKNHKGFDVASNRILDYLKTYMSKYGLDNSNTVFWITGHSRGAAIANLISAKLIDDGRTVFAYTFAAPNTTIATNTGDAKYQSIFNIVNEDDFVPCVPMTSWKFRRYGRTATVDMTSSMEKEWHKLTGKSWYNQMSLKNLNALVDKISGVSKGWDYCYKYTCACHGGGTDKDITQSGLSASDVKKIPTRALQYCMKTSYKSWGQTKYKVCQVPGYFMQILAEITAANGLGNQISAVLNYKLADRYEGARTKLVSAATIGGIAHPHFCETYYIVAQHTAASNFK